MIRKKKSRLRVVAALCFQNCCLSAFAGASNTVPTRFLAPYNKDEAGKDDGAYEYAIQAVGIHQVNPDFPAFSD
jgi:hypothetical protein